MNLAYLTDIIILLMAAVITVPLFRLAGLGTVLRVLARLFGHKGELAPTIALLLAQRGIFPLHDQGFTRLHCWILERPARRRMRY